ncbi:uncharacterized protein [Solanum lycopersicum]|uniref:uncharacterized protein n=1 Tax=Solanum lycopersicum TaxID=4081 RepID=UPI0037493C65
MAQMRTELGLVLIHVIGGAEKINAVNYLSKPPPQNDECYYEEDTYTVNEKTGVSYQAPKAQIRIIGAKVKGTQVGTMVTTTVRFIYVRDGNYNRDKNFNRVNYANRNDRNGLYVPPQNRKVTPRDGGDSMAPVEDMFHKIMRRFDTSDEHIKELRCDLASIGQKIDTHVISIKQIELQVAQLSTTVNTQQPGTLPSKTVQNPKNGAHCMTITTRGGRQTIDPPMPSTEENLSINVPLVEALEQMPDYAKFMKDLVTKKRSVIFEDNDRLHHCSAIATRSLVQQKEDPGAFTIPCTVGSFHFAKALCDLGAIIKLMPLSINNKLGLWDPKPTAMRQLMADQTVKRPIGILHDVLVKVESFIFSDDFVILDCEVDFKVPIILGRPFLATGRALVDMENG